MEGSYMALSAPIRVLKSQAKKLARDEGITHLEALDRLAKREGFQRWSHLVASVSSTAEKREIIASLPLLPAERGDLIVSAKRAFERVLDRMEPDHPQKIRDLWNVADYVDNHLLGEGMLPISYNYALSLIDAFLVHHVIDLAGRADKQIT
jgi:hypothetical protein